MKSWLILAFLASNQLYAQTISMSHGIGEITKELSVKSVIKALGEPDTNVDNSCLRPKNAAYHKLIYAKLGITFWYSVERYSKSMKGSTFWYLEVNQGSLIMIDGLEMSKPDTLQIVAKYGFPKDKSYWENEIIYSYDLTRGKYGTMISFRWNRNGAFNKMEVAAYKYP